MRKQFKQSHIFGSKTCPTSINNLSNMSNILIAVVFDLQYLQFEANFLQAKVISLTERTS